MQTSERHKKKEEEKKKNVNEFDLIQAGSHINNNCPQRVGDVGRTGTTTTHTHAHTRERQLQLNSALVLVAVSDIDVVAGCVRVRFGVFTRGGGA